MSVLVRADDDSTSMCKTVEIIEVLFEEQESTLKQQLWKQKQKIEKYKTNNYKSTFWVYAYIFKRVSDAVLKTLAYQ